MKLFPDLSAVNQKINFPILEMSFDFFIEIVVTLWNALSWGKKDIANYTSFKKYKHWGCIFLILYESTHIVRSDAFNVLSDILDDYIICKAT